MKKDIQIWLRDILRCIEEIETFLENRPKDFNVYLKETMLRKAIERNLEIIGEAMNRILKEEPTFVVTNARKIVDLRNTIIHGYDVVNDANIWSIVINHLPKLKAEVEALLKQ